MRYFIEIAYKGTDFHGWQIQPNAISVQEIIQKGLSTLLHKKTDIFGAGRTDAGVHARQIFAHFDTDVNINEKDFAYKLNALTPKTVLIRKIKSVLSDAHARFDATSRSYEYHILLANDPFLIDTAWQLPNRTFDINKMNEAAKYLLQYTNFKAFSKSRTDVKTFDCIISHAKWIKTGNQLVFYITANRFLRNMVRAIVGTILDVGEEKINIAEFEKIILNQNRSAAGVSVPAKGLYLTKVKYPKTTFNQ